MGSIISAHGGFSLALSLALLSGCDADPIGAPTRKAPEGTTTAASDAGAVQARIQATSAGFEPSEVHLKQGKPGVLLFTRVAESECVNAVRMPWMSETVPLPMNETVSIAVDTSRAGTFSYACWMNMVFGRVVIDPS